MLKFLTPQRILHKCGPIHTFLEHHPNKNKKENCLGLRALSSSEVQEIPVSTVVMGMRTGAPGFSHQAVFSACNLFLVVPPTHTPRVGLPGRGEQDFKCQGAGGCSWGVEEELGAEGCLPQTCQGRSGCSPYVKGLRERIKGLSYH